jgi:hypothetical protein
MQNIPSHQDDTPHYYNNTTSISYPSCFLTFFRVYLPPPPLLLQPIIKLLDGNQGILVLLLRGRRRRRERLVGHLSYLLLRKVNVAELLHHGGRDLLSLALPLHEILFRVVEVFVRRNAKNTTVLELASQGDNVKLEKATTIEKKKKSEMYHRLLRKETHV